MAYHLEIIESAQTDIEELFDWLEAHKTGKGFDFLASLTDTLLQIENNPYLFAKRFETARVAVIQKISILVMYEILGDKVIVFQIIDSKQNPNAWRKA